jgi:rubredoxin-NAD+ reductase
MSDRAVVIIGTGLAGYNVARELRKADAAVPIVIVSRDHAGFYSKPMLSNALASKKTAATLVMKPAEKMAEEIKARVLANNEVKAIDTDTEVRTVTLASGEVLPYRDLVLALGADPIRIPLQGDAADTVLSVNDLDDFARFAEALERAPKMGHPVKRVVILGAGLIGCEFANDLLAREIAPTVVDLADRALARLLPPEASTRLEDKLTASGARFRFGVAASSINHMGDHLQVALSDGSTLETDLVLSAIGLKPRTHLALEAGVLTQRGVLVNRHLKTNVAHVYAVGDCAEVEGHLLPFVMPLMQQARALAATLAGRPTPLSYPAMPVVVKTPAWPTVVCPPPADAQGQWAVTVTDEAIEARFLAAGEPDKMLGFVLQGKAVAQRQAMASQVPALLA